MFILIIYLKNYQSKTGSIKILNIDKIRLLKKKHINAIAWQINSFKKTAII